MRKKCFKCGLSYDGWNCPVCSTQDKLAQQQKGIKDIIEKSSEEQQRSIEYVLEEQKRLLDEHKEDLESAVADAQLEMDLALDEYKKTTSNAWKLQAESKTDRAYDLMEAGLFREAIDLCSEAIKQDPGNVRPYLCAAGSFGRLRDKLAVKRYLSDAIKLLLTSEYKAKQEIVSNVLSFILMLKENAELIASFIKVSRHFRFFPSTLLHMLMEHSLYGEAQEVLLNTMNYGTHLIGHAYRIDLGQKVSGKSSSDELIKYLRSVPYSSRKKIFEEFNELDKQEPLFSPTTHKILREKILERYEEWKPEITEELSNKAYEYAKHYASDKIVPKTITIVVGWVFGIFSLLFLLVIVRPPDGLLPGIITLGSAIGTGVLASIMTRKVLTKKIMTRLLAEMEELEGDSCKA